MASVMVNDVCEAVLPHTGNSPADGRDGESSHYLGDLLQIPHSQSLPERAGSPREKISRVAALMTASVVSEIVENILYLLNLERNIFEGYALIFHLPISVVEQ